MADVPGHDLLAAALEEKGWTQTDLANRLGLSVPSVWSWLQKRSRPTAEYRKALQRILGIPEDEWMTEEDRAKAYGSGSSIPPAPPATGTDDS